MIKLTSLYPFSGFLRVTQEFYDEKFIVKTKSLTFAREEEHTYSNIADIADAYYSSGSQMNFGFWLLVTANIALYFFCKPIYANPALLRITQTLLICGMLLFITSFIKSFYIVLFDKDGNALTSIKLNRRNRDAALQVTEMIMRKSKSTEEISITNPFPETEPVFEHSYYDISKLEKTTDRFYDDEIIGVEKSPVLERVYRVKYKYLSGKPYKMAIGGNMFGAIITIAAFVFFAIRGLYQGFSFLPRMAFLYTAYMFLILLAISFLAQFIKRGVFGLYGKNEQPHYWAYVNRADKEKIEKIVEFVQSRIPAENKETSLKE